MQDTPAVAADTVEILNAEGTGSAILLCDHASNRVPAEIGDLGLPEGEMERHIAYDIGAAAVTREMSRLMQAPALLHGYSRLALDPNRAPDDPTLIPVISDGTIVPANRAMDAAGRRARIARYHQPYHDAVASVLAERRTRGQRAAIISLHSFTPWLRNNRKRPWEVGVLWGEDGRMAVPFMAALEADGVVVGDNEPYSGRNSHGFTIEHHAMPAGLPHVLVELRQDLIADTAGQLHWAGVLARVLQPLLTDEELWG
ncbi:N-formylglutamate amidohydrolase [Radicibacter daui]|uniref:N-formylglutamate amidohydrolase n=1 Tax=Radicibacter daui TaxID=3064829 RepID=UPI004046EB7F